MEIDNHTQSKFSLKNYNLYIEIDGKFIRETSYSEIENVIRDISYVRHQSTNFLFLYSGQFDFESMLTLPYWDFLFVKGDLHDNELVDIQDGCLLIISLFFIEIYDDNGGCYIYANKLFDFLDNALNLFQPATERQRIIVEKIKYLSKYAEDEKVLRRIEPDETSLIIEEEIGRCNEYLYDELIEKYYWETAKSFEIFRQQSAEQHKRIMANQKKP